ncbi:PREDICTED: uncharacterized protein LOC109176807 [Ipomoea nil]|uniref:uncharacterized protein LOC109176807 n=1 Tax=Ipomoea nil TaxID=35883 RepID=UPI000901AE81|nr:PREDICTED: uncharacterized protein LOC109176807 [Ipomoea nil]XP_019181755.1 PREDICTED: uncharacterized protein LOC109176807 [Ipomoea nil]
MQHLKQTTTMQILPPPNPFLQFNKWDEARQTMMNSEMSDHSGANSEIEFQTRSDYILHSPSLWTQRASKDQAYYHPSPRSRLNAIVDGQRKLMEMIQNLPESSLELSLKDIVLDNPQGTGDEGHQEVGVEDTSVSYSKANDKKIKRKSTTFKHAKISRSESMDSGVFLLKMFVPLSLYTKTKSKTKNCSKISPNPPSKETDKPAATKDWWKMIYLHIKQNSYSRSIKRSLSSISIKESISRHTESRLVESSSLLDEPSFDSRRYTSKNQRGCLF